MIEKEENNKIDARKTNADKYLSKKRFAWLIKWEMKSDAFLSKSWIFVILVAMIGGGATLGTLMYINYGVGAFGEIFIVKMIDEGFSTSQWSAIITFALFFLIGRVLEAPQVGILDIGTAILSGIGIGMPAILIAFGAGDSIIDNPGFGILIGGAMGTLVGIFIILIRKYAKKGLKNNLGTDVMIGTGNQVDAFFTPLILVSATMVNPFVGLGSSIGAIVFYIWNKPVIGGALLGVMIFGTIPAYI